MTKISTALALGASLYVPATHAQLWAIAQGFKYPQLRSVIICLEDSILEQDIPFALQQLKQLLQRRQRLSKQQQPTLFIRPRNIEMFKHIVDWQLNHLFDGIVIPKFSLNNLKLWQPYIWPELLLMPTLETVDIFDMGHITELKHTLKNDFSPILCIRIGGNDLFSCLNLRRPAHATIYDTPLGTLIAQLVTQFIPMGFQLSAPVCENFSNTTLLQEELKHDLMHGLYTKTAIHPSQIDIIQNAYKVSLEDYQDALEILSLSAKAVFKSEGAMLEPATHRHWAEIILKRADIFGIIPPLNDGILHIPYRTTPYSA